MAWNAFNETLTKILDVYLRGDTQPSSFKLLLMDGSFDETSSYPIVLATEIASGNGYTAGGYTITPSSDSILYAASNLASGSFQSVDVTASGGNISFQQLVVTADDSQLILFEDFGSIQTVAPGTPRTFQPIFNMGKASANVNTNPN